MYCIVCLCLSANNFEKEKSFEKFNCSYPFKSTKKEASYSSFNCNCVLMFSKTIVLFNQGQKTFTIFFCKAISRNSFVNSWTKQHETDTYLTPDKKSSIMSNILKNKNYCDL